MDTWLRKRNLRERDHLGDKGTAGRITSKWMVKK
jgi:hypothetical protein